MRSANLNHYAWLLKSVSRSIRPYLSQESSLQRAKARATMAAFLTGESSALAAVLALEAILCAAWVKATKCARAKTVESTVALAAELCVNLNPFTSLEFCRTIE
jgi:hypothetical protein